MKDIDKLPRKNRTNPNPRCRNTLIELRNKSVIAETYLSLRSRVYAQSSTIINEDVHFGYSDAELRSISRTHNVSASLLYLRYQNKPAAMEGFIKFSGSSGSFSSWSDPSLSLPRNHLAEQILIRAIESPFGSQHKGIEVYGDALLIHDRRRHWMIDFQACDRISMTELNDNLTTDRIHIANKDKYRDLIIFRIEPNEDDLLFLKMHYL